MTDAASAALWKLLRRIGDLHIQGASADFRHPDVPGGAWFADGVQVEPVEHGFVATWPSANDGTEKAGMAVVRDGARLCVAAVDSGPGDDPLAPVVDQSHVMLRLHVQHSDGSFSPPEVDAPLRLNHPHSKSSSFRNRESFDAWLVGRIGELQVHKTPTSVLDASLEALALFEAAMRRLGRALNEANKTEVADVPDRLPNRVAKIRSAAEEAIEAAARLGYVVAESESAVALRPVAVDGLRRKARDKKNSEIGNSNRRRDDLRDAAKVVWGEHPEWSRYKVAMAVAKVNDAIPNVMRAIKEVQPATAVPRKQGYQARG